MSKYKLVVRFAPYGTNYLEKGGSISKSIGHVWYEVYKDNEKKPMISAGWSTGENRNPLFLNESCGEDNLRKDDWERYKGKNIASITVDISEEQAMKLKQDFPTKAMNGNVENFRSCYNLVSNSCIDFAGQALAYIGLTDQKDFDGKAASPISQVGVFLGQIAKHRGADADLKLEYFGKIYEFKPNERTEKEVGKIFAR